MPSRRSLLRSATRTPAFPLGVAAYGYHRERRRPDTAMDGLPADPDRASELEDHLTDVFGADQLVGIDPNRRDLLVDVRTVGEASVAPSARDLVVKRFRENDIFLQWLEHPDTYERDAFAERYGFDTRRLLWGPRSFYWTAIAPLLRSVAVQLIVVPGTAVGDQQFVYSPLSHVLGGGVDGHVNGFSLGNRAVVAAREDPADAAELVLHELGHLALCHDDDPANSGVMGRGEEIDLTPAEWATLRDRLDNVRDRTGFDVVLRPCLWRELILEGNPV